MLTSLLIWTLAVYGFAWLGAKAKLTKRLREVLRITCPCLVCFGIWVGFALMPLVKSASVISFEVKGIADVAIITGWNLGALWLIARMVGDAD